MSWSSRITKLFPLLPALLFPLSTLSPQCLIWDPTLKANSINHRLYTKV